VTVCIPTYDRVKALTERALPSVLAQTHRRLEVLVMGDASPPHVAPAVEGLGDERVRFVNLTHRHAATDAEQHWLVGSVPPRNAGYALAKGHWIVDCDDDDAMRPEAIERVLTKAREERLEVVYGKLAAHFADGTTEIIGRFPPTVHQFGWQCAVVHNGLRFLGRELVSASFGHPNDWFRVESMMRIGVRIGMVDDVLYDYYPARSWQRRTPMPDSALSEEPAR
jgi:glycosyltransferase involved in cell wall biosynthesis